MNNEHLTNTLADIAEGIDVEMVWPGDEKDGKL